MQMQVCGLSFAQTSQRNPLTMLDNEDLSVSKFAEANVTESSTSTSATYLLMLRYSAYVGHTIIVRSDGGEGDHRRPEGRARKLKFKFRLGLIKSLNWLLANRGATPALHFTRIRTFHSLCEFPSESVSEMHRIS